MNENSDNVIAPDITVVVDHPQKQNTFLNISIYFRVITKTTRNDYDKGEYLTYRPYDDFLSLRDRLHQMYPCTILPPLQDYNNLVLLKSFEEVSSSGWMRQRLLSFDHFANTLARHPVVSRDGLFKAFLTQQDFAPAEAGLERVEASDPEQNSEPEPPRPSSADGCCQAPGDRPGLLGSVFGRLVKRFSRLVQENATALVLKGRCTEFQEYTDYATRFNGFCQRLDRLADHLTSEFSNYGKILEAYIAFQDHWATLEPQNADLIKGEALANVRLRDVLSGWIPRYRASGYFLKNYSLYIDSMRDAMQSRDEHQVEYELTREEYLRRQKEVAQILGKGGRWSSLGSFIDRKLFRAEPGPSGGGEGGKESSIVKDFRTARSQLQMEALELELERNKMASTRADAEYRQDFTRWHSDMVRDFRGYFVDLATLYVDMYTRNLEILNDAIEKVPQITVLTDEESPALIETKNS